MGTNAAVGNCTKINSNEDKLLRALLKGLNAMFHVHKVKRDTFELCSKISYRKPEANYT